MTNSLSSHLFNRIVTEQKLLDEDGPATRTFINLLDGKDPRGIPHWETRDYGRFNQLDDSEQRRLFLEVSLEAIRKYPVTIAAYTPHLAWKVLMGDPSYWIPEWGATIAFQPNLENSPPLTFTTSSLVWRFDVEDSHRFLWPILCWFGLLGQDLDCFVLNVNLSWRWHGSQPDI